MNESIIDPMLWYYINIVPNGIYTVGGIALGGLFLFGIINLVNGFIELDESTWFYNGDKGINLRKSGKMKIKRAIKLFIWGLLPLTLLIFTPNKTLIVQMFVLDNITFDRVEKAVELGKDIKDEIKNDIIDIIQAIDKENK